MRFYSNINLDVHYQFWEVFIATSVSIFTPIQLILSKIFSSFDNQTNSLEKLYSDLIIYKNVNRNMVGIDTFLSFMI